MIPAIAIRRCGQKLGGNQKYFFLNPDLRVVFGPVHVVAPSKKTPGGLGNACGILEHGAGY